MAYGTSKVCLGYMGIVLATFPLMCGFIMVQSSLSTVSKRIKRHHRDEKYHLELSFVTKIIVGHIVYFAMSSMVVMAPWV